jgi:hypothetical protein
MYDGPRKQNLELQRQQQAHLAEAAKSAQVSAAMRELASKDRKHRLMCRPHRDNPLCAHGQALQMPPCA